MNLSSFSKLFVKQTHELGEWFGFETRNKYRIVDEQDQPIAFAAEQQKGIWGFLLRQYLGHWRSFEIHIFSPERQKIMTARHPFRFFFQRLEIRDENERPIGALQQRFAIFTKRFDVQDELGNVLMTMSSPFYKLWTFPFERHGNQVACILKKWSGILLEAFTDKDTFLVEFTNPELSEKERCLVLSAALFIDLRYFETKASNRSSLT